MSSRKRRAALSVGGVLAVAALCTDLPAAGRAQPVYPPTPTTMTIPTTTTTSSTTTSTTTTSSTTTSSTTTSSTMLPNGPGTATTFDAVTRDGLRSGPPGVELALSGLGYDRCRRAYAFFDGVRIGTSKPDRSGTVDMRRLSVPGDADPGPHDITLSCDSSGRPEVARAVFVVLEDDVHRSAFVTSLNRPDQISVDLAAIGRSALAAALILLLFAFPSKLFNSTVEENYDEIRSWFRRPGRAVEAASTASRSLSFIVCHVVAAVILAFLSPDFAFDAHGLVLVLGFTAGLVAMAAGYSLPAAFLIHRRTGEWGKLNFLPGTLLVALLLVVLSRLLQFQPGYFYGALAGLAFASALSNDARGRVTAANWVWALVLSVGAWFAHMRVSELAAEPGASVWWIGLEACLVLMFLWGIESVAVAMLPMRFLDGPKVIEWNRIVWAVLMFLGVFATVHVLLAPNSGYVGHTTDEVAIGVLILFGVFAAISVGLWAYFRYRPRRWIPRGRARVSPT